MSDIYLYVYDLTKGMARQFSPMFLGQQIDGVWHTGIVAYGTEWYFGNDGIGSCPPKGTPLGDPNEMILLGRVEMSYDDFEEILRQLSESSFKIGTYNLIEHNCNNFSNELAQLLVGKSIPSHILDLPKQILNSPIGPMLKPFLEQAADPMQGHKNGQTGGFMGFGAAKKQPATTSSTQPAQQKAPTNQPLPNSVEQFRPDVKASLGALVAHCESHNLLSVNEHNLLVDTKDYLAQTELKWSIAKNHVKMLFALLHQQLPHDHKLAVLNVLQRLALNADLARHIVNDELFKREFLTSVKSSSASQDLTLASLRLLSNLAAHSTIASHMLATHQDLVCKELGELILTEASSDLETLVHEASISFFYNMVAAYHLEGELGDANALALGVALLERLPKFKARQRQTTYRMLALLRSCLVRSHDVVELAHSMDFSLGAYKSEGGDAAALFGSGANAASGGAADSAKSDTYGSIVENIDELIHEHAE